MADRLGAGLCHLPARIALRQAKQCQAAEQGHHDVPNGAQTGPFICRARDGGSDKDKQHSAEMRGTEARG